MKQFDHFLTEIALRDAGKTGSKLSDFERAAGSQGINLGKPKSDAHHVDYPDAKHRDGTPARTKDGKVIGGSAVKGKLTKMTHGEKLKDAVAAKGRVKRGKNYPAEVERRKEVATQNKAAKKKYNNRVGILQWSLLNVGTPGTKQKALLRRELVRAKRICSKFTVSNF